MNDKVQSDIFDVIEKETAINVVGTIAMYCVVLQEILGRKIDIHKDLTVDVELEALRKFWRYKSEYWYWKSVAFIFMTLSVIEYMWFTGGLGK